MKKIILVLGVLTVLFMSSCSDKGTDPEAPKIDPKYNGTYNKTSGVSSIGITKIVFSDGSFIAYAGNTEVMNSQGSTVSKINDTTYKCTLTMDNTTIGTPDGFFVDNKMYVTATLVFGGTAGAYTCDLTSITKFTLVSDNKTYEEDGDSMGFTQQP